METYNTLPARLNLFASEYASHVARGVLPADAYQAALETSMLVLGEGMSLKELVQAIPRNVMYSTSYRTTTPVKQLAECTFCWHSNDKFPTIS